MVAHEIPEIDLLLMDAFNFTEEDLDANQHGYISKPQRIQLRRKRRGLLLECIVFCLLLLLAEGLWIGSVLSKSYGLPGVLVFQTLSVPFIVIAVRDISGIFNRWRGLKFDLYKGDVKSLQGILYLESPTPRNDRRFWWQTWHYKVLMNGKEFILNYHQWNALTGGEGRPYCLYIAPNSEHILAVERVH